MRIGILSDTHGNIRRTALAAERLRARGVAAVLHCGDIGSADVLRQLAAAFGADDVAIHAVRGNVDLYDPELESFSFGAVTLHGEAADLRLAGKRVAVIHGDDGMRLREAIGCGDYDYVFTGHTHAAEDRMAGRTRVINPGAIHRAEHPGCAVLDLASGQLEFLRL